MGTVTSLAAQPPLPLGNQQPPAGDQPPLGNPPPPAGNQPPVAEAPRKGYLYRCVENCVFNKRPYKKGETVVLFEKKEKVPHFEFAGETDKV